MDKIWKAAGAAAWGAAAFSGLRPFMGKEAREKAEALCPDARTVLVAAFPYYAGEEPGNLSLYCRGEDYHAVLSRRLGQVCRELEEAHPGHVFCPGADNSPIPELRAAELAGVGHRGRHGLRIVPPYGSYVFLGTILTDLELPPTRPSGEGKCPERCAACIRACPTGALTEAGCDLSKCLSELTQAKGDLSPEVRRQIQASPTVWGCDLCQRACPQNRDAALTPLPEFRENLKPSITREELEGMSNKKFRKEYADRAFSWRGIAPLKRNLALQDFDKK
jgi:epoxyqueuosine reductase